MGIASLVLGIISIIVGFVPFCGAIAFLPALIGLILGIVDMVKKSKSNEKKGQAIAGIIMCALAIIVIFFWLFVVAVGSDTNLTENTISTSSLETTKEETEKTNASETLKSKYNVGETFKGNNLSITYLSVDDDFKGYNRYATIKDGYKIVKADFEFENLGSSDKYVSSFEFDCFADGYDCEKFYYVDDSSFSSTLSSGKKSKGSVYFEVPEESNSITLEYSLNSLLSSRVEFIVK